MVWAPPVYLPVWQQDPTRWCSQLLQPSHQYRSQVAQRIGDSHSHQARAKSEPLTVQMRKGRCCSPLPLTQPEQLSEPGLFSHSSLLTPHSCSSECSSSVPSMWWPLRLSVFSFVHTTWHILVPQPGVKPLLSFQWKLGVVTTGLPGNSLCLSF